MPAETGPGLAVDQNPSLQKLKGQNKNKMLKLVYRHQIMGQ